eukprot:336667-Chlamydomonas_euryale.AAC.3
MGHQITDVKAGVQEHWRDKLRHTHSTGAAVPMWQHGRDISYATEGSHCCAAIVPALHLNAWGQVLRI